VAEEGWAGVSDAGESDAAGTDAEGFGGAVDARGIGILSHYCPVRLVRGAHRTVLSGVPKDLGVSTI
jgi:hypothetical protein